MSIDYPDIFSKFKASVIEDCLNGEQLFQKYFVDNKSYYFIQVLKDEDVEYAFFRDVAETLNVHLNDLYLVGSGKVGFSMAEKKLGNAFDSEYTKTKLLNTKSDLDVAVISEGFFDWLQENIYDWSNGFKRDWNRNTYYPNGNVVFPVSLRYKFLEYLGRGWYRPDFSPPGYSIGTKIGSLSLIKDKWERKFQRRVSFAIYRNWNFFKKYQIENVDFIAQKIKEGAFL